MFEDQYCKRMDTYVNPQDWARERGGVVRGLAGGGGG